MYGNVEDSDPHRQRDLDRLIQLLTTLKSRRTVSLSYVFFLLSSHHQGDFKLQFLSSHHQGGGYVPTRRLLQGPIFLTQSKTSLILE
jgi:hypothetical protein